jgi:hypothetical protein
MKDELIEELAKESEKIWVKKAWEGASGSRINTFSEIVTHILDKLNVDEVVVKIEKYQEQLKRRQILSCDTSIQNVQWELSEIKTLLTGKE